MQLDAMPNHLRVGFALVTAALASVTVCAEPVPIAIANSGFEADIVSEGCFQVQSVSAWPVYDPNGILNGGGNSVGGLNLPVGSVFFPGGAPEGNHAALVFLSNSIGAGPAGLTQVLGDTLQADTTYTLSVQIGNIASGTGPPPCDVFGFFDLDGFPGYQVQLLAGGVVVAEDDNALAGTIPDGEFRLSTIELVVPAAHPQLGQALEIRLINLNTADSPESPGIEVDFDDVILVAQPAGSIQAADFDSDCDVDLGDFTQFALCIAGPNLPPSPRCPPGIDADLDNDLDVDMVDFSLFSTSFTGDNP